LLRGATSLAYTWCKRGLDRLSDCAGTLSPDFYRINGAVPGRRFPSPLSGTPSLYAWVGLRESAHVKTPARDILDRCDTGAWPDRHTVACPAILLTMRSTRFILIIGVIALPWTLFAGNLETVALDVKNMTCALCPITVKKALEKVPGVTRAEVDFNKKTARVTFDPDKNQSHRTEQSYFRRRLSFHHPQLNHV
jgi:periplasmic mercuric ion binding protein